MPIQSNSRRYTFPVKIDKAGIHYGLYLFDADSGSVQAIDDEVHSAIHVNGILVAGAGCDDVRSILAAHPAGGAASPRAFVEGVMRLLADKGMINNNSSFVAVDFRGRVVDL